MQSALLHNGQVVSANEYNAEKYGERIFCMDTCCRRPVVFVKATETKSSYFKTTGHNGSTHTEDCAFYKPLDILGSIKKVEQYQNELLSKGIRETLIKINLSRLDPDREIKEINKDETTNKRETPHEIKIKSDSDTPESISSLRSIVKLFSNYGPDILSSIIVNVKGTKIPISSIIVDQEKAHYLLWNDSLIPNMGYFVYGTIESVLRREKVYYINLVPLNSISFTIVVFEKHFKYFTYSDQELIGKTVLSYGYFQKNTNKNTTIMPIKSDKYLEKLVTLNI